MSKKWKLFLITALSIIMMFGIVSCSSNNKDNSNGGSSQEEQVTSVYFEEKSISLLMGETCTLVAKGALGDITWSSNDSDVAMVDQNGLVTAVGIGETVVKADDGKNVALCRVEVIPVRVESVLSISLDKTSLLIQEGDEYTLAYVVKNGGTNVEAQIEWKSSNEDICTVENGKILAKTAGNATVTVTASYGDKETSETVSVTVEMITPTLVLDINDWMLNGEVLELNAKLMKRTEELSIEQSQVVYEVDNKELATVSEGALQAHKLGTIRISAFYEYENVTYTTTMSLRIREEYAVEYFVDDVLAYTQKVLDDETFEAEAETPVSSNAEYEFCYWMKDGKKYDFTLPVTENLRLDARWVSMTMRDGDDYSISVFGSYAEYYGSTDGAQIESSKHSDFDGGIVYGGLATYSEYTVYLPRIDYRMYDTVVFEWSAMPWMFIGIDGVGVNASSNEVAGGIIKIINNAGKQCTVIMTDRAGISQIGQPFEYTYTFTDIDTMSGKRSIGIYIKTDFSGGRAIHFSIPKFTGFITMDEESTYEDFVYGGYSIETTTETIALPVKNASGEWLNYLLVESGTYSIMLPRIDYSKYDNVTFDWVARGWTIVGLPNAGNNVIYGLSDDTGDGGEFTVINNGNGTLTVVMTATNRNGLDGEILGEFVYKLVVEDEQVLNGKKGLEIYVKSDVGYRWLNLSLPTFKETAPMDRDGSYNNSLHGARVEFADGTTGILANDGDSVAYMIEPDKADKNLYVYLPRIDYTKQKVVQFDWSTSEAWIIVGLKDGGYNLNRYVATYGTITIVNNGNGTLTVTMFDMNGRGEEDSNTVVQYKYTLTVSDLDVINGRKVGIAIQVCGIAYRQVTLSTPRFYTQEELDAMPMAEGDDYSRSFYGAYAYNTTDKKDTKLLITDDGKISLVSEAPDATNIKSYYVYLPRIDYTKYEKVSFTIEASSWVRFGLYVGGVNGTGIVHQNSTMDQNATAVLTISNNHDGTLTAVMTVTGTADYTYTVVITDQDVITGKTTGIGFVFGDTIIYRSIVISLPTFTKS